MSALDNIGRKLDGFGGMAAGLAGRAAGGIGGFFSSVVSMRVLAGMFAGVLAMMGILYWQAAAARDKAQKTNRDIGTVVAQIAGVDPTTLKADQIIPTIRVIGTDRDTARRERDNFQRSSATQTKRVRELGDETRRLRLRADEAVALVRTTIQQRNVWIERAKVASTRTERETCENEIKQAEDVLNALYDSGF